MYQTRYVGLLLLPKLVMMTNTTIINKGVSVVLINPIDAEVTYTIIFSGFPDYPYRVVMSNCSGECSISDEMNEKQLIKYLDIRKEFPLKKALEGINPNK